MEAGGRCSRSSKILWDDPSRWARTNRPHCVVLWDRVIVLDLRQRMASAFLTPYTGLSTYCVLDTGDMIGS